MRNKPAIDTETMVMLDRRAIQEVGIPSAVLMENAGRAVAVEVIRSLKKIRRPRVSILCGLGNNAGDGFVVARHLIDRNISVKTFLLGNPRHLKADAFLNYQILKKLHRSPEQVISFNKSIKKSIAGSHLIVDAIFGVGLNREITGFFKEAIDAINEIGAPVIAVDIPSGLDATTGRTYGVCIKARRTVTFTFIKKGFLKNEGPRHVGKVVVADIGIPKCLTESI